MVNIIFSSHLNFSSFFYIFPCRAEKHEEPGVEEERGQVRVGGRCDEGE